MAAATQLDDDLGRHGPMKKTAPVGGRQRWHRRKWLPKRSSTALGWWRQGRVGGSMTMALWLGAPFGPTQGEGEDRLSWPKRGERIGRGASH
jgi:hypothetical protein